MIFSLRRSKHMWISRGHVRVWDSITHCRSGRSEVPTPWRGSPDEPALMLIRSETESHLNHTCPEPDDKALRLMIVLESAESHERRKVVNFTVVRLASGTLEASQLHSTHAHIWMLMWIICRFTQSTPRPRSAGGASTCERELAVLSGPWTFLSTQTTLQEMERGAAPHPQPMLSAHPHPPHVKSSLFHPAPHLPAHRSLKPCS